MKKYFSYISVLILIIVSAVSCNKKHEDHSGHDHQEHGKEVSKSVTKDDHDHDHDHDKKAETHEAHSDHDDHGDHDHEKEHKEGHKEEHKEGHKEEHKEEHNHDAHDDHDDHANEEDGHDHDHGSSKAIGEGKAIEVVDEQNGFKIHENAKKLMNLTLVEIKDLPAKVQSSALVYAKDEVGVYRVRQSFYKFIVLKKESSGEYLLTKQNFAAGDQVVTSGLDLLRISDVYSQDKSEYGHSH